MEVIYSAKSYEEEDSQNDINPSESFSNSPNNNNINLINSLSIPNQNNYSDIDIINSFEKENISISENTEIPINQAVPFVIYENDKFIIPKEAKILLNQKKYEKIGIGIISLVGKYRTGKSFLLNRVILNSKKKIGFSVGPTFRPCTKGIWIWSEPIIIKNNENDFPCFLIDTEGLGAYDEEVNHDSKIFLIAILISSLFIFNSFGTIDENAISSLSFVLNLSKTIKIKSNFKEDDKNELAKFFPSFLWLLRDFSLKLEDINGNQISEKQYLEYALENIKNNNNNDIISEKNRVRSLIRTYFPERDCFTMVRPVENENDLQNLQNLPDNCLRKEFLEQAKNFREKVFKKVKQKIFCDRILTGSMLIKLVENILESINGGGIPIIENSWKYVMKNECVKKGKEVIEKFVNELKEFSAQNMNNSEFYKNMKEYTNKIYEKYVNFFDMDDFLDNDTKKEYGELLKIKLKNELDKYNRENEKIFEKKFIEDLNILSNNFMENFKKSDIYEKNSYKFFQDFENFRENAINATPDFPQKNEILFEKILLIIKNFINSKIMKIKIITEEKNYIKEENQKQDNQISLLTNELNTIKSKNNEYLDQLNNELKLEKNKHKKNEEKFFQILNNKNNELENLQKDFANKKINYEMKLKEIIELKDKMKSELKAKEEQLIVMKVNNNKITSLYEQKSQFLEKEILSWKEKYNDIMKEIEAKENENNNINNNNLNNHQIVKSKTNNNLNNLMNYVKIRLKDQKNKFKFEKIAKNNEKYSQSNGERTHKENISNEKIKLSADGKLVKIRTMEEKNLINLNQYKDTINTHKDFQCKFCQKIFSFLEYKEHYGICEKNPLNANLKNNSNNNINLFKNRTNNSSNNIHQKNITNSDSNKNKNRLNNLNNINKYSSEYSNDYCGIINNITNNNNGNNNSGNNYNNINININNKNININRNLININNIKKINNNIHLNNFFNINNKSHSINHLNKNNANNNSNSNLNINSNNMRHNYNLSPISNITLNPKKLKLKIIKGRIRKDKSGKPYLEYKIDVNYSGQNWQINKRFNQFTNLYKGLKLLSEKTGIRLPDSANIFSNIGTLFSGLSHENKIIMLEKFLKEISETEGVNNSKLFFQFIELEYEKKVNNYVGDKDSTTIQSGGESKDKNLLNKNNNKISGGTLSNNINCKFERIIKDNSAGCKKLLQNHIIQEMENDYYEPKTMSKKEIKNFNFQLNNYNKY